MAGKSPFSAGPSGGSKSPFASAVAPHKSGGILGAVGGAFDHLANDVKDAVVGIPAGIITTIEHPIRAAEVMGESEWMLYSPLFHGHFARFGKSVYDHPLMPLLDLATVFSLGVGGAARVGELVAEEGESSSLLARAAKLRQPKGVVRYDPTGEGRIVRPRQLSQVPGRRLMQEGVIAVKPHLPMGLGAKMDRVGFEKAHFSQMTHRHAALARVMSTIALAGKALTDDSTAPRARVQLVTSMFMGMRDHAVAKVTPGEGLKVLKQNKHYSFIRNTDGPFAKALGQVRARENRLEAKRVRWAGEAHILPQAQKQLEQVQARIAKLQDTHRRAGMSDEVNAAAEARGVMAGKLAKAPTFAERKALRKQSIAENAMILDQAAGKIARKVNEAHGAYEGFGVLKAAERRSRREGADVAGQQGLHELLLGPSERAGIHDVPAQIAQLRKQARALNGQITRSTKAKGVHTATLAQLSDTRGVRLNLEKRSFEDGFAAAGASHEAFTKFNANFANFATTKNVHDALRDENGLVSIVPKHDAKMLGHTANTDSAFVRSLGKATNLWKLLQVAWTVRTVVNNTVGNWAIAAMRELGREGSGMALLSAMRSVFGDSAAAAAIHESETMAHATLFEKWFGDQVGNTFGHEFDSKGTAVGIMDNVGVSRVRKVARQGAYPLVHKVADEPVRKFAIEAYLRRDPEVKRLMKGGMRFEDAADKTMRADIKDARSPVLAVEGEHGVTGAHMGLRDRAALHAERIAGDYQTLQSWEQGMRKLVPFYLWDRHIVRSTGNLLLDSPARVAVMQQVSNQGVAATAKYLGALPEFLKGAVPLSMLGLGSGAGGRSDVLMTQSLNPFGTIGDLASTAQGIVTGGGVNPGEALLSSANPFLTGGVEYATGTSLLTGAPLKRRGGLLASIARSTAEGLPQVRVTEALLTPNTQLTPTGKQKLYTADDRSSLSSLFGVPLRSVALATASAMADKEQHRKKPKKRASLFAQ